MAGAARACSKPRRAHLNLIRMGPGAQSLVQSVQRRHLCIVERDAEDVGVGRQALTMSRFWNNHQ